MSVTITIPDSVMDSSISESELKQEIAVMLFEQERLTLGQASQLANMKQDAFQRLLGSRNVSFG